MSAWQDQQHNQQYQQPWQYPTTGRSSWQDPRLASQNSYQANLPVAHTPVSPLQGYNVPPPPDTSNWGVNFNHTQQAGHPAGSKPPLPPRPSSSLAHTPSPALPAGAPSWPAPAWQTPTQQIQFAHPHNVGYGAGYQWTSSSFPNQQLNAPLQHQNSPQSPAAPQPPPRPSAYQSQAQLDQSQRAQHQYSHHTPLHHYDSNTQAQISNHHQQSQETYPNSVQVPLITQAQTPQADERPPVSPEETHAVPWKGTPLATTSTQHSRVESGASALGAGGPSDWEHFQGSTVAPEDEDSASTANALVHSETSALNDQYAELPAHFSLIASRRDFPQHVSMPKMEPTSPGGATSEVPVREGSVSPELDSEGLRPTATIDGLIQEWSTPLSGSNAARESRKSSVSTLDHSRRDADESVKSSPRQAFQSTQKHQDKSRSLEHDSLDKSDPEQQASHVIGSTRQTSLAPAPISTRTIEVDPYSDLGPENRASLCRYVTMLRKEETAPEDEKYKIFEAFVMKESRLRSVLYNVDPDDSGLSTIRQAQTMKIDHRVAATEDTPTLTASATPPPPKRSDTAMAPNASGNPSSKLTIETTPISNEDFCVGEQEGGPEYSPGGRPRVSRNAPRRTASHPPPMSAAKPAYSPSDYAPIVIDEIPQSLDNKSPALKKDPFRRPGTAPMAVRNGIMDNPIKFEPPRPAYTPFRYVENPQRSSNLSVEARPAYQAYSALRHQSEESGRVMTQSTAQVPSPMRRETLGSPTSTSARREHEEAFLGLIRETSRAYRAGKQDKAPITPVNDQVSLPEPVDRQTQAVNALRKLIPRNIPLQQRARPKVVEARIAMDKYLDVFTWIPETVVRWDRENKILRMKQEAERQKRQEESEKTIDALFNDHEIGYSDIGQLEADFKLAEATKEYEEDAEELESFTDKVFKPVTERLKEELLQLNAQYIRDVDMLELEADSGNQYLHGNDGRVSRSEAMEVVLALYKKLQIRHVKTAEANYERERRRKKLELSVLYTNGDTAAMKKLEIEFTRAERQQSLHDAREKDNRANKLMDTFDRATVRGLGDNQQFIDDVVVKLQAVGNLLKEKQGSLAELLPTGLGDLLRSTEELLDYVANDSKLLLTISNTADNMLNNADYDVSVAEAKVANATLDSMKVLEKEKKKEDERIRAEVETRMGSVAKGPENALTLVKSIMKRLGEDPQHHDRVQKALEAAKLRNASKAVV